ncbi:MAG: FHA domain-containing protein [Pseudomonadota bacterium]
MVDEDGPISMAGREVVGWLVIVKGPGRGAAVPLEVGMNSLGRGPDVTARINFGDTAISRDAHAYVTYDHEKRAFHLSHAGQQNVVRVDDEPVVASNPMTGGELVRIGETTLQFVAFCGADFDWLDE